MSRGIGAAVAAALPVHTASAEDVLAALDSSPRGLTALEARERFEQYGANTLPQSRPRSLLVLFVHQFLSPFIYVLLFATALSAYIQHWSDALFISLVVLLNAVIGMVQEHRAEHSALALRHLVTTMTRVVRDDDVSELPAAEIVPGDVLMLASGDKVPADLRLIESAGLLVDESTLTGESLPVQKDADLRLPTDTDLADRRNCAFAGTLVTHGRAEGVVTATGSSTTIGALARSLAEPDQNQPPLVTRMRQLTLWVAAVVGVAAIIIVGVEVSRGASLDQALLLAVALAVSAIPEGLPVALTVALAIATARMARRHVIVRHLVAVEALGSCTVIASDKTGTLTVNELTVTRLVVPGAEECIVTGAGTTPEGDVEWPRTDQHVRPLIERLARTGVLCNEGSLAHRDGQWTSHGDPADVALLVLGRKLGITQPEALATSPLAAMIAFEPERRFAASLHEDEAGFEIAVKGAWERVLEMCDRMSTPDGERPVDARSLASTAERLASAGHRVLAVAGGPRGEPRPGTSPRSLTEQDLTALCLYGLVAMTDPVRPDAAASIAACREAGVVVDMITGDHPATALAIARELGMADGDAPSVVTGRQLRDAEAAGTASLDDLVAGARIFARVEPQQKLDIVRALTRLGHIVAVTGDGANDAPALRQAHVGVAMGQAGTDVAREAAELILTDDTVASITAGVEEGRVAYANVRKVVQLLVTTGAGEVVLVLLAVFTGAALPVLAVQLLWLNLVTNGIQDVALAFEPAEGNEMRRAPRAPDEPVFDRLMLQRLVVVAVVLGGLAFVLYRVLLDRGWEVEEARNGVVLALVLSENVLALSARSETRSLFQTGVTGNRVLLAGVLGALGLHLIAMQVPLTQDVLRLGPVPATGWLLALGLVLVLLVAVEADKYVARRRAPTLA